MELAIRVYLTSRDDPVKDLDSVKTFRDLEKWKADVKPHAIRTLEFDQLDGRIIDAVRDYTITGCYAVVAHPEGKHKEDDLELMLSANKVGAMLLQFLKDNSKKLTWDLEDTGESAVSMEAIMRKLEPADMAKFWDNFTYGIISDGELSEDTYEIDLEFVVKA